MHRILEGTICNPGNIVFIGPDATVPSGISSLLRAQLALCRVAKLNKWDFSIILGASLMRKLQQNIEAFRTMLPPEYIGAHVIKENELPNEQSVVAVVADNGHHIYAWTPTGDDVAYSKLLSTNDSAVAALATDSQNLSSTIPAEYWLTYFDREWVREWSADFDKLLANSTQVEEQPSIEVTPIQTTVPSTVLSDIHVGMLRLFHDHRASMKVVNDVVEIEVPRKDSIIKICHRDPLRAMSIAIELLDGVAA